ncbi:MAG: hypothetical protein JWM42_3182 [Burkholderia sp.]|nr:hypothetical protein [Burkholderia sp.]
MVVDSVSDVIALTASRRSCGLAPILACQNISMNKDTQMGTAKMKVGTRLSVGFGLVLSMMVMLIND